MLSNRTVVLPSICDGFIYNPQLRANTENYDIMGLGQMEMLRRSRGYIPKLVAVPDYGDGIIENYQSYQKQVSVTPGSWLWSVTLTSGNVLADGWYFVTVRDDDTGDSLFGNQFVANQLLRPEKTDQSGPEYAAYSMQKKLSQPRLISGKGVINVQINCTSVATPLFFQVILCLAQPCGESLTQDVDPCVYPPFNN